MATYYVNPSTGNDGNAGTSGSPKKTIMGAVNVSAASGDTIILQDGVYSGSGNVSIKITKSVNLIAANKHGAIIDGGWPPSLVTGIWANIATLATNINNAGLSIFAQMVSFIGASNITIDGIVFRNWYGVLLYVADNGTTVRNNVIKNCVFDWCIAQCYVGSPSNRLNPSLVQNQQFTDNIVIRCGLSSMFQQKKAIVNNFDNRTTYTMWGGTNAVVARNLFFWCGGEGGGRQGTAGVLYEDNIVLECQLGIYMDRITDWVIRNNIVVRADTQPASWAWNNCRGIVYVTEGGTASTRPVFDANGVYNRRGTTYNNILINASVDMNGKNGDYFYPLTEFYFGHNTIVNNLDSFALRVTNFSTSNQFKDAVIENNIIENRRNATNEFGVSLTGVSAIWRNNIFPDTAATGIRGPGTIINNDAGLNNTLAPLNITSPLCTDNYATAVAAANTAKSQVLAYLNNLRPKAGSIGINKGSTLAVTYGGKNYNSVALAQDYSKAARVNGPDIGAFELGGATPPTNSVTAAFTSNVSSGTAPLTVNFTSTSSVGGTAVINSYAWNFGNGQTSTAQNPSVTYTTAGTFTVSLTVRDTVLNLSNTVTGVITVTTTATMTASFTQLDANNNTATGGPLPYTVTFTNTSTATGKTIDRIQWDWGGGTFAGWTTLDIGNVFTYTYTAEGTYTPRVRVWSLGETSATNTYETYSGTPIVITEQVNTTPIITPSFTINGGSDEETIGTAPFALTLVDTSSATNATIDTWLWRLNTGGIFGDTVEIGNTATVNYTITTPGYYTIFLDVGDSTQQIYSSTAFLYVRTLVEAPSTTPNVKTAIARKAAPTSTGDWTINAGDGLDLDGLTPDAVIFLMSKGVTNNTNADGAMFVMGATNGVNQFCIGGEALDNVGTTSTRNFRYTDAVLASINNITIDGMASFKSFETDSVTLDVTDAFPAGYLVTVIAIAGSDVTAYLDNLTKLSAGNSVALSGAVESRLLALAASNRCTSSGTLTGVNYYNIGLADVTASAVDNYNLGYSDLNDKDTSELAAAIVSDSILSARVYFGGNVTITPASKTLTANTAALPGDMSVLQLALGDTLNRSVTAYATPTATGNVSYDIGFEPELVIILLSTLENYTTVYTNAAAEGFALIVSDGTNTYSTSIGSKDNAGTSDTYSRAGNSVQVLDGDGNLELAGAITLDADGFDIDWTTVQATARRFVVMAIEGGSVGAGAGPVAQLAGYPRVTTTGTVQFFDVSNANGSAITSWLWDFGDGNTSTEQNPIYTYLTAGTFTVSLTVTNGNGSNTVTRTDYIQYVAEDAAYVFQLVGPYNPLSVTNYTTNRLYSNADVEEEDAYVSHAIDLDGVFIDESPEDNTQIIAGKLSIFADPNNLKTRLLVRFSDGTVKKITLSDL